MRIKITILTAWTGAAVVLAMSTGACSRDAQAYTPQQIEQRYGVSGAYADTIATPDGTLKGTVVPVTLADGRRAQLVIPAERARDLHAVYLRDEEGLHPVMLEDRADRVTVAQSPRVVRRTVEPAHPHKRSWEKEALIVGGSAGAGAAIGALAAGKKGAGIGAATGGVGGLIYDLATRKR